MGTRFIANTKRWWHLVHKPVYMIKIHELSGKLLFLRPLVETEREPTKLISRLHTHYMFAMTYGQLSPVATCYNVAADTTPVSVCI